MKVEVKVKAEVEKKKKGRILKSPPGDLGVVLLQNWHAVIRNPVEVLKYE